MCNSLERFDTTMANDPVVEARSLAQVRGGGLAGSGSVISEVGMIREQELRT